MASPIDDDKAFLDGPLGTFHESQPHLPEDWEHFIDFNANQGYLPDVQSSSPGKEPPSSKECNSVPITPVREHVYSPRFPGNDPLWDLNSDSNFIDAEEVLASQQSHAKIHYSPSGHSLNFSEEPSKNTSGRILEISQGYCPDGDLQISGDDVTIRSEKRHHFSKSALALLRKSFDRKSYPSAEEKRYLTRKTGGTQKQISTWFSNARRRAVPKSKDHVPIAPDFPTMDIIEQGGQSPLQRYLNSPPEDDPVPIAEITAAASQKFLIPEKRRRSVSSSPERSPSSSSDWNYPNCGQDQVLKSNNVENSEFAIYSSRATSDRGYDSISLSGISNGSSVSNSSQVPHASWAGRRGRKRFKSKNSNQIFSPSIHGPKKSIYQCTWCWQGFTRKDSWKRHEESEHCPQHEYVCMLHGYTKMDALGVTRCVFCGSDDISEEHLALHSARECYDGAEAKRSFARSDALVQHIRQKHRPAENKFPVSAWRRPLRSGDQAKWSCGFCQGPEFTNWDRRCQHVAQEFEGGFDMTSWRGSEPGPDDQGISRSLNPSVSSTLVGTLPVTPCLDQASSARQILSNNLTNDWLAAGYSGSPPDAPYHHSYFRYHRNTSNFFKGAARNRPPFANHRPPLANHRPPSNK